MMGAGVVSVVGLVGAYLDFLPVQELFSLLGHAIQLGRARLLGRIPQEPAGAADLLLLGPVQVGCRQHC